MPYARSNPTQIMRAAGRGTVEAGDVVDGRYLLVREIGRGAAGTVFEAQHLFTGRFVALKMVRLESRAAFAVELFARLRREARALGVIAHPGVVGVLDGGVSADGAPYLVMEMLQGRTLEGLIASRGKLRVSDAVGVGLQLCAALDAVHRAGVVHRDVKPGNVLVIREIDGSERLKLVDFGVARVLSNGEEKITRIGAALGSPAYASPEQLESPESVGALSDVYSAGVTLFECLAGSIPYSGGYAQIVAAVVSPGPVASLQRVAPDVPPRLCEVVERAMAKAPGDRFASALELSVALRAAVPHATASTSILVPPGGTYSDRPEAAGQRRRAPRTPYNTPVHLMLEDVILDGRTEDLSTGGVFVVARQGCRPDQRGTLRFALPMDGKVVSAQVEVRWVRAAEGGDVRGLRAIGVAFVDLPEHARESIARYVALMAEHDPV